MLLTNQSYNCGYQKHQCNNSPSVLPMSAAGWGQVVSSDDLSQVVWRHKWSDDKSDVDHGSAVVNGARVGRHHWRLSDHVSTHPYAFYALCGPLRIRFRMRRPTWQTAATVFLSLWLRRQPASAPSAGMNAWFALATSSPTRRIQFALIMYKWLHGIAAAYLADDWQ